MWKRVVWRKKNTQKDLVFMRLRKSGENVKNVHVNVSRDNINNSLGCLYWVWKLKKKLKSVLNSNQHYSISWLNPRADKMKRILRSDWPPEWASMGRRSCSLGISRVGPARKSSLFGYIINPLLTKPQMVGYWPRTFFAFSLTSTSSRSIKTQKRTWPTSGHLDLPLGQYAQETTAATVAIKQ